jgi:hypothetical protein
MEALGTNDLKNILRIVEIAHAAPDCDVLGRQVLDAVANSVGAEKGVFMLQRDGASSPTFFYGSSGFRVGRCLG